MGKEDMMFILEMVVQTAGGMINEPIGIYEKEEEAQEYLEEALRIFATPSVVFNILQVPVNIRPPILDVQKKSNVTADIAIAADLYTLYSDGIIEQMVDEDGSFSYQLSRKYQGTLEDFIEKGLDF